MTPSLTHHSVRYRLGQRTAQDGLNVREIDEQYPMHKRMLKKRGILYRHPQGESFMDVVNRLTAIVIEVEREKGWVRLFRAVERIDALSHVCSQGRPYHNTCRSLPSAPFLLPWNEFQGSLCAGRAAWHGLRDTTASILGGSHYA